jgi:hypothetical protein
MRNLWNMAWVAGLALGGVLAIACGGAETSSDGGAGAGGSSGGNGGSGGSGGSGGGNADSGSTACFAGPLPVGCPTAVVTYGQVEGILKRRCVDSCHNMMTPDPKKNNEPIWSLATYRHAVDWADTIRETINHCMMPPQEAQIPITIEERTLLVNWVNCKTPQ